MSWGRWFPSPFGSRAEDPQAGPGYYTSEDAERERHRGSYQPSAQYTHYQAGRHPQRGRDTSRSPIRRPARDDDILIFRYKSTNYPLKFPAYSIDDRRLTVGYAREKAAEKLDIEDPDRLKMIYKGRKLDDDGEFFCDLGFVSEKPAEIFCSLTGAPINRPSERDSDEDDDGTSGPDADPLAGAGKKRKNKKKKRKAKGSATATPTSAANPTPSLPYPTGGAEYLPMPSNMHPLHRAAAPDARPSSASSSQPNTGTSTPAPPATPKPQTPLAKLDAIASAFHTTLVPQCVQYMASPPADPAKRRFEHKKLTETVLTTVMLKLDAVETEGDVEARARRKELVREAQGMMNKLDESLAELKE